MRVHKTILYNEILVIHLNYYIYVFALNLLPKLFI